MLPQKFLDVLYFSFIYAGWRLCNLFLNLYLLSLAIWNYCHNNQIQSVIFRSHWKQKRAEDDLKKVAAANAKECHLCSTSIFSQKKARFTVHVEIDVALAWKQENKSLVVRGLMLATKGKLTNLRHYVVDSVSARQVEVVLHLSSLLLWFNLFWIPHKSPQKWTLQFFHQRI